nr:uncharacterized protein LOC117682372 [Crassostrea gigas]
MGPVLSKRLSDEEIRTKVVELITKLDIECQKVLHKDMKPVEVALLLMLHQKHSDIITFNASEKSWSWKEGTLRKEYETRLTDLDLTDHNPLETTDNFIKEAKTTIQNVDALFDNLSSEENREETLNTYFEKQTNAIAKLNIGRTKDLKDQLQNSSNTFDDASIRYKYRTELSQLNEEYKEKMMDDMTNQLMNMSAVLDQFHKEQLEILQKMDKELLAKIETENIPSTDDLLKKVKKTGDPVLGGGSRRAIEEITTNIKRSDLNPESLKRIFTQNLSRDGRLEVAVIVPNRDNIRNINGGDIANVVADHVQHHQPFGLKSLIERGKPVNENFMLAATKGPLSPKD